MHAKSGYTAYRVPVADAATYYNVQIQVWTGKKHQNWVLLPENVKWAMKKKPGCLGYIGDYTTQLYGV